MNPSLVIHAHEHGILPNTQTDSGAALRALLSQCRGKGPARVKLLPGRYDFHAEQCEETAYPLSNTDFLNPRRCAVVLRNLEDVQLDLTGVLLCCHGRLQPITIDNCQRVSITGGQVDWDFPLTAQGTVTAASSEILDLQIDYAKYPFVIEDGRLVFTAEGWSSPVRGAVEFDPATGQIPPMSGDRTPGADWRRVTAEDLGEGRVRLHGPFACPPSAGNVLVLRHGPRNHAGVFIFQSRDITVSDFSLHHTSGLGILCQHSEDLEFSRVQVVPSAGRSFSGHDDGIHVSNCRGHVQILECRFAGLMDDPVNVHGTSVRIIERLAGDHLRCRFIHPESVGMRFAEVGDTIAFLDHRSLCSRGELKVRKITVWDLYTFDIAFEGEVTEAISTGDALENLTWSPEVTIRDSFFGCSRARGLLISTPRAVRVEANRFESSGSAILIAGDANHWYESGAVRDVLIRNNVFTDICNSSEYQFTEGVISIFPEIAHPDPLHPFHRNIRIEDNEFETCELSLLYAFSVEGLRFSGNRIKRSYRFAPRAEHRHEIMHEHNWAGAGQHLITLDHCRSAVICDNDCQGDLLNREVFLLSTAEQELTLNPKDGLTVSAVERRF